jgi:hypothetical protein
MTLVANDTNKRQMQVDVDLPPVPRIVIGNQILLQQT